MFSAPPAAAPLAAPLDLPVGYVPAPVPGADPVGQIVGNGLIPYSGSTQGFLVTGSVLGILNPTPGYVSNGGLHVSTANFEQGYSTLNVLGLPLLNLTAAGLPLVSTGGNFVGQTGVNSSLTLVGAATSNSYIYNINNGAPNGLLGLILPGAAPAWAAQCLNVAGLLTESCWGVNAAQNNQVLVGDGATANGSEEVVIGTNATHTLPLVNANTAFPGDGTLTSPTDPEGVPDADYAARLGHSVVIGDSASGTANAQTILGANATSDQINSVALGFASIANRGPLTGYLAPGLGGVLQNSAGEVSIGSPGLERQITNVAPGSALTDAVNVAQLDGVGALAGNSVQYDDPSDTIVTLAGPTSPDGGVTGGTTITNLHQGALSATSTDAVNGAQLFATNNSITNINNTGTKYFHANSVGPDSNPIGVDSVAIGTGAVANNAGDVALGAGSATAAPNVGVTAFFGGTAAGTAASVVSIGTPGLERQIQNVAPGVLAAASTDAVNGSQLFSVVTGVNNLGTTVATSLGGTSTYNAGTGAVTAGLSYSGGTYTSVQNVLNALTGGGPTPGIEYFHANSTLADSNAAGANSVAVGPLSNAGGVNSVAVGNGANAAGDNGLALGAGANASMANSVALGAGSATLVGALTNYTAYGLTALQSSAGEVNVGNRQITGVAAGAAADDAVNVAQLEGVGALAGNSVQYDDPSHTIVTLTGPTSPDGGVTGGTTITNLHQGALSATSTDAVNGAQLFATNNSITNINNTGTKYFQANSVLAGANAAGVNSVAAGPVSDAGGVSSVAVGNGANAAGDNGLALGAGANASMANSVALGAGSATLVGALTNYTAFGLTALQSSIGEVNVGNRQITGVAAGSAADDAVNVAQLEGVGALAGNSVQYDDPSHTIVTLTGPTSTDGGVTGGTTITNLHQGALSATSTDAVNGAQLFATNNSITNINNTGTKYFQANSVLAGANAAGVNSVAAGPVSDAGGVSSVAVGNGANAAGDNGLALGAGANASMANSVALGAGSATLVGALTNYTAYGLTALQSSAGEVNVGNRQISGVAAGSTADDAVNVAQLEGVGTQVQAVNNLAVKYDADALGNPTNTVTLTGDNSGAPVGITNLAVGAETATSTAAVNGSQLWHWTQDPTNIYSNYSLYNDFINTPPDPPPAAGAGVKYFNVNSTLANSTASGANSIAIGPVAAASGVNSVAVGNGATATADNSVAIGAGSAADRDNTVSVGAAGNDRQITNVAAGTATTDAVNVGQLTTSVAASTAGNVRYDTNTDGSVDYGNVNLGNGTGNTMIHNVAPGTAGTDAVNVNQLNGGVQQAENWATAYTNGQVQQASHQANAGIAAAMAIAGLPQAYEPGKSMAAVAAGTFRGESSLAVGVSTISENGRWVYKLTGSTDSRGDTGVSIGAGTQW